MQRSTVCRYDCFVTVLLVTAQNRTFNLKWISDSTVFFFKQSVPSEFTNGNVRKYIIFVKAVGPYRFSEAKNFSTDTSLNFIIRQLFPWTIYNVSVQAFTVQAGPMSPWEQAQTLESGMLKTRSVSCSYHHGNYILLNLLIPFYSSSTRSTIKCYPGVWQPAWHCGLHSTATSTYAQWYHCWL